MTTEIRVPSLGESITEGTIGRWLKSVGEAVALDEQLADLETDKVAVEINAPVAGVLVEISAAEGATVEVGSLIGIIDEGATASVAAPAPETAPAQESAALAVAPAARKLIKENALDPGTITGSGKDGRITKVDVLNVLNELRGNGGDAPVATPTVAPVPTAATATPSPAAPRDQAALEERVPMTRLRKRIAERLKEAQNTAAMLTTFNEVDMTNVMAARKEYREVFEKKHGVRLGFMSFFVKAAVVALKDIPAVNGEIDGGDIVYKNYYHLGVAVSTPSGLVVPVLRDADKMGFADIEKTINDLGVRARDGKLKLPELQGGTFTISNGGVFGSLMSTPILNPPQSGILGMHKIQKRPVAIGDNVEVRPMMYLALTYDHRIVDGREAVTFLVRIKECVEDPQRILLDI